MSPVLVSKCLGCKGAGVVHGHYSAAFTRWQARTFDLNATFMVIILSEPTLPPYIRGQVWL
jgi:hypothetical protein